MKKTVCLLLAMLLPSLAYAQAEPDAEALIRLLKPGTTRGLRHHFEPPGRMTLGALSWIDLETRPRSLLVQAFHTFPDDLAIVKSQSLFELP